jgi:hypothetical protein
MTGRMPKKKKTPNLVSSGRRVWTVLKGLVISLSMDCPESCQSFYMRPCLFIVAGYPISGNSLIGFRAVINTMLPFRSNSSKSITSNKLEHYINISVTMLWRLSKSGVQSMYLTSQEFLPLVQGPSFFYPPN